MKPSSVFLAALLAGLGLSSCKRGPAGEAPSETDSAESAEIERFVYVCDQRSPGILSFRLDEATGAVALAATSSPGPGSTPQHLAIAPAGRIAYGLPGGFVVAYALAVDGGVSPLPAESALRPRASKFLIARDGRHLYTLEHGKGVAAFEIGPGGALAPVGAPLPVAKTLLDAALAPSGRALHVLVRTEASGQPPEVVVVGVDATSGGLSPSAVPPLRVGHDVSRVRVHPSGRFACVIQGGFKGAVDMYEVDPASGALARVPGSPFGSGAQAGEAQFHPSGRFFYVLASSALWAYAVDAAGGLRRLPGSPFEMGESVWYFALDPDGRFLYAPSSSGSGGLLGVWAIDPEQGTVSAVAGSPFSCGRGPVSVARRPGAAVPVAMLPPPTVAEAWAAASPGPEDSFGLAEASVTQLALKLRDPDWRVRYYAAIYLKQKGPEAAPAVPFLTAALRDPNETVVERAAYALEGIGPPASSAAPALIELLRSDKPSVRRAAASALGKIGSPEARDALAQALGRPDYGTGARPEAATALAELGATADQIPALLQAIATGDHRTRKAATDTLGGLGPAAQPAVPDLIALLDHDNADLRKSAAEVLGRIGPGAGAAIPTLYGTLQDQVSSVREAAAGAIRSIRRRAVSD